MKYLFLVLLFASCTKEVVVKGSQQSNELVADGVTDNLAPGDDFVIRKCYFPIINILPLSDEKR